MKKINPFLWFDSEAEQAAKFYVGIFKNSKIGKIASYPKEAAEKIGRPPESVMTVEFTLDRVDFGSTPKAFGAVQVYRSDLVGSLLRDPGESRLFLGKTFRRRRIDRAVGSLKDKFGLSWQINPVVLGNMLGRSR
jgi:predicted 3-demethylubiquinone-9 3-methyltransferase (glyoxalase superfamily)